jgi:hypothetical protein
MGKVEQVSKQILAYLLTDFQGRDLGAEALHQSYVGVPLSDLKQKCFENDKTTTTVDFELALKDLESRSLVATGPMVPHENPPNSAVVFIGLFSKREYLYLTEKGYKAAR